MAEKNKYALTGWGAARFEDVTLPSGQTCRIRRTSVQDLVARGVLTNLDSLTSLVAGKGKKAGAKVTAGDEESVLSLMADKERFAKLLETLDAVALSVVVEPEIWPNPANGEDYVEGRVYVGDIELEDKTALLNIATSGVKAMEKFRSKPAEDVGSVSAGEADADDAS